MKRDALPTAQQNLKHWKRSLIQKAQLSTSFIQQRDHRWDRPSIGPGSQERAFGTNAVSGIPVSGPGLTACLLQNSSCAAALQSGGPKRHCPPLRHQWAPGGRRWRLPLHTTGGWPAAFFIVDRRRRRITRRFRAALHRLWMAAPTCSSCARSPPERRLALRRAGERKLPVGMFHSDIGQFFFVFFQFLVCRGNHPAGLEMHHRPMEFSSFSTVLHYCFKVLLNSLDFSTGYYTHPHVEE